MKLIFGLLALIRVVKPEEALGGEQIGNRTHAHISFPDFPDGIHVTFLFNLSHTEQTKRYINFYASSEADTQDYSKNKMVVHLAINPYGFPIVITDNCNLNNCWKFGRAGTLEQAKITGRNSNWWRVDVYKIDDKHLAIGVRGFWSGIIHELPQSLSLIRSAYVFEGINTDNVFVKYRTPNSFVPPMKLTFFESLLDSNMRLPVIKKETTSDQSTVDLKASRDLEVEESRENVDVSRETRDTPVSKSIGSFPKDKKLFITAWLGSNSAIKKGNPSIQFVPADFDASKDLKGVFTIYQEWDKNVTKGRKSSIGLFNKKKDVSDKATSDKSSVDCVVDGSAADFMHYRVERVGDKGIKVFTFYSGSDVDPTAGKLGKSCESNGEMNKHMMNLDKPIAIHGLNGAAILHVDWN